MNGRPHNPGSEYSLYEHERAFNLKVELEKYHSEAKYHLLLCFKKDRFSQDFIDNTIVEVLAIFLRHEQDGTTLKATDLAVFLSGMLKRNTFFTAVTAQNRLIYIFISTGDVALTMYDKDLYADDHEECLEEIEKALDEMDDDINRFLGGQDPAIVS